MPSLFGHQTQNIENRAKLASRGLGLSARLALAMVSLVVVTTVVLSFITYRSVTEAAIPRALDRLATKAGLSASKLETALNSARQDMLMVQGGIGVAQLSAVRAAVPFVQETDTRIRESIAARFLAILSAKPDYAQLRIIGIADGGRELVRVDRRGAGGAVRVVPDAELMQVGQQDYFRRALSQPGAEVYASPIAFQKDRGAGGPASPMLHLAIALRTPNGQPFGISVLDFDLGPKFDLFRADTAHENLVFIANGAGEYLLHPEPSREFAFAAGAKI